jgi:hypothetical protein
VAYRALARSFLPSRARRQAGLLFSGRMVSQFETDVRRVRTHSFVYDVKNGKALRMKTNTRFGISAFLLILAIALPAFAYEYPLSADAIRDAYFLGSGQKSKEADFYAQYSQSLGDAKKDPPGSFVTIDTPFLQIAEHSRDTANYHAQDAEKDFFEKPMEFRVLADVYYKPVDPAASDAAKQGADASDSLRGVRIRLIQHRKEIAWRIVESWPDYPFQDAQTGAKRDGEHVEIACDAAKIDSSILTLKIDLPDGQHFATDFDLAEIK